MVKQLINRKKYNAYLKCEEDNWGVIDISKTILSEEEYKVLSNLNENLKDYYNNYYSKEFKKTIKQKIDKLKSCVTHEVFQILEKSIRHGI